MKYQTQTQTQAFKKFSMLQTHQAFTSGSVLGGTAALGSEFSSSSTSSVSLSSSSPSVTSASKSLGSSPMLSFEKSMSPKSISGTGLPSSSSSSTHLSQSTFKNTGRNPSCFMSLLHHFSSAFLTRYTILLEVVLLLLSSTLILSNRLRSTSYGTLSAPAVAENKNFPSGSSFSFTFLASGNSTVINNLSDL
uniref:Putative ovule protein n=1 Tax=Solanum chacoense TaxID=4108 RepID=A0A0V0HPI9_SOLCH